MKTVKMVNSLLLALLLCFLQFSCVFAASATAAIKVTFISVAAEDEVFWGNMTSMAQAAANDLQIELEVLYSDRNHIRAVELAREVAERKEKPDYLIVVGEKNIGSLSIAIADRAGIKTLLLGTLIKEEEKKIGKLREKYPNWIGQRQIDDFGAGYLVAKSIIDKAIEKKLYHTDGKIYLFGLSGVFETSFNRERVRGFHKALAEYDDVVLLQNVPAFWRTDKAKTVTKGLLRRYLVADALRIGAIWCANTDMALGAVEGARQFGLTAGEDIFISGIDYTAEGIQKVQSGEVLSVVGGHFAEIAWLLVMIYDYHHGNDFLGERDKTEMFTLDKNNAELFITHFSNRQWDLIDFTQFSKVAQPQLLHYNFSFKAILEQFKE